MAPKAIETTTRMVSRDLTIDGIPHALIGGLAIGAYGSPRATSDIDFVIPVSVRDRFGYSTKLTRNMSVMTINYENASVDYLFSKAKFIEQELDSPIIRDEIPIVSIGALIYLKMVSNRNKDERDIINLISDGIDIDEVREYLNKNSPSFVDDFDQLVSISQLPRKRR